MVMNKPAGQGTVLPWHQDGGNVWALDRDPLVTVWVALDPATRANGCLEVIPGTHRLGLLSLYGGTVAEEHVRVHCPPERVQPLEVRLHRLRSLLYRVRDRVVPARSTESPRARA